MFNFDPIILRQSTSEIDICWQEVDDCDVYKIEHNTMGLEGKIVYWYLYILCKVLPNSIINSNVLGEKIRNARYPTCMIIFAINLKFMHSNVRMVNI